MSSTPQYSVVVTTYNRAATLRGAVESLLALSPESPPYELIVVDNNSTDDTRRVVEALVPQSGGRLRYVFEPRQGASHGRNAGAAAARGAVLAFTDDDVRASPGWLVAIDRVFAERPEIAYTGGVIRPIWPAQPPAWLIDWFWSPLALIDYGDSAFEVRRIPFRCFVTANMAVRKAAFDAVGGFDPRYQHAPGAVTASEDHELQIRLLDAGYRGWYEPSIVMHAEVQPNRLTKAYHRKWAFDHGRAVVRMTPPGTLFDGNSGFEPEPAHARHLFGAPLFLYKEPVVMMRLYLRAVARLRTSDRLWAEFKFLECAGMIAEYIRSRHERAGAGRRVREVAGSGSPRVAA
jgi:glycosyltransferase involved in cell wall biosynthesis